jgi:hypothetical protein
VLPVAEVEAKWSAACKAIRNSVLAIPSAALTQELRAYLIELADNEKGVAS